MARNRVIGKDGVIPWRCPEDMKFFKEHTTGHYVLMGRKTADSLPNGFLKDRSNFIVTSQEKPRIDPPWKFHFKSVDEAIDMYRRSSKMFGNLEMWPENYLWVIGGASIYEQCMGIADEIYLNMLYEEYDGDTYFPVITNDFELKSMERKEKFYSYIYERKK